MKFPPFTPDRQPMKPLPVEKRTCGHKFILGSCSECSRYLALIRSTRRGA